LKLLLDEMCPPAVAEQLRERRRDVEAVAEHSELRALADVDLFAVAQQERRAVVTENIDDFSAIADDYDRRGQPHHGLVFVNPRGWFRGDPRTIGRMVTTLGELLDEHQEESPTSLRRWL
jgi:Domain of unknown function (DUF5615)